MFKVYSAHTAKDLQESLSVEVPGFSVKSWQYSTSVTNGWQVFYSMVVEYQKIKDYREPERPTL